MKVVTLKLKNQREWNFLRNILQRLNVSFEMLDVKPTIPTPQNDIVAELFGSFSIRFSKRHLIFFKKNQVPFTKPNAKTLHESFEQ